MSSLASSHGSSKAFLHTQVYSQSNIHIGCLYINTWYLTVWGVDPSKQFCTFKNRIRAMHVNLILHNLEWILQSISAPKALLHTQVHSQSNIRILRTSRGHSKAFLHPRVQCQSDAYTCYFTVWGVYSVVTIRHPDLQAQVDVVCNRTKQMTHGRHM